MGLEGLWRSSVLDSSPPPQSLRPATHPEHQDPASHSAQKKRKKKQTKKNPKLNRLYPKPKGKNITKQTKSHKETYIYTLTKREKRKKN